MKRLERYVIKDGKKLRCGYTTGSCATAASKASVLALVTGTRPKSVEIDTPKGVRLEIDIETCKREGDAYVSAVRKDAGDDPDVTDGIEILSRVSPRDDGEINIYGGLGIGTIRRSGFWGQAGQSAINRGPREMILKEIRALSPRGFDIEIFSPEGLEISKKTYNRNIGIEGGISIIGTTGIVEPMSDEALKKSIYLELDSIRESSSQVVIYPGNYGERIAEDLYPELRGLKVSNFVGDALSYAQAIGFKRIILLGHIGKFSKLAMGAFNTHSKVCDMRMESFVYYLALRKRYELIDDILDCITTEEAVERIRGRADEVFEDMKAGIVSRVRRYLKDDGFELEVVIYSMEYGVL